MIANASLTALCIAGCACLEFINTLPVCFKQVPTPRVLDPMLLVIWGLLQQIQTRVTMYSVTRWNEAFVELQHAVSVHAHNVVTDKAMVLQQNNHLYKLKRCSNKECCKQCRYVMFKGTMTKWPVQKLAQGTTQKLLQHHDATDI